jgi:hypothetical protein
MGDVGFTALITGASAGIGAEFARQLAAQGRPLVLAARRGDRLEEMAKALATPCEVLVADLATEAGLSLVEQRIERGDVDLLVNNAGFGTRGLFWEADPAGQERMHRLHVMAAMRLCRAALPHMVRRGRGGIMNVSSVAAFGRTPGNASYCATKAWMNAFTEGLHMELRVRNSAVRVQALCPGFTYTEFHDVLGVDRSLAPKGWWLTAEQVVADSLRGLERGRLLVIPGLRYRLLVQLLKYLPDSWRIHGAIRHSRRMKRI